MPTLTNTQGALIAGCTPNDTVSIVVNSGAYSLEYPLGTVLASAVTTSANYQLGAGQFRLTTTGSVTYTLNQFNDVGSGITLIHNSSPNITLNDTSSGAGTTATPFGQVFTIPGGLMGANSAIRVWGAIDWVGGNSKSVIIKVGQSSDTWSTASTNYSGQGGLSTQKFTTFGALIWNDGVSNAQRGNPNGTVNFMNASTSLTTGTTTINTALDWNIWIGVQFGTLNGGDTATLRRVLIELIP